MHLSVSVVKDPGGLREVNKVDVLATKLWYDLAHIRDLGQRLEQWNHLKEAPIVGVIVPGENWYGILVMEVVGVRGVIHNDHVFHVTAEQTQILDVGALE